MNSLILKTATRYIFPLLILVAIFLLLRGHHEPGGGFIAGLVASCAVVLVLLAWDVERARQVVRFPALSYMAFGLLLVVVSGSAGAITGEAFLTGKWITLEIDPVPPIKLGTPLLFDVGVSLVVFGITLMIVFGLASTEE